MESILLIMSGVTYTDLSPALTSARALAAHPKALTFGLTLMEEPTAADMQAMLDLGGVQFLCPAYDGWPGIESLWQGETHILMGHPGMRFTRRWDALLLRDLRACQAGRTRRAVLTGYLPRAQDPVDAVSPVAAERIDESGYLHFQRGTPLRYARAAEPAAFIHPDFCFAPADFYREPPLGTQEPWFLRASRCQWNVFTAHRPRIRLEWDDPMLPCDVRELIANPAWKEHVRPFEQRFGIRFGKRTLSPMAKLGIFRDTLTFPMRVPVRTRAQELMRGLSHHGGCTPLCVTAYLTLPTPTENLPEESMSWFRRLIVLRELALLCYADGESVRRIAPIHPNVLEYKPRYGLPSDIAVDPADALNYVKLSKPFLLAVTREKFLTHSHYVWIDFGCLRYPVYEHAYLDWESICTDRIVLAVVDGLPDASMIVVPERLLKPLCKEFADRVAREQTRLPRETALWTRLIHDKPEWFDLRILPGHRELFTLLTTVRGEEYGTA